MKKDTVFYSWQSDLPNDTNLGFIQKALENAVKSIRDDDTITVEPVLDRDTKGVPGSPDIFNTILNKIDQAQVFVCDVSIINSTSDDRPTPNPNVLVELGYAIKSLGLNNIIIIMNTSFGALKMLPFDLNLKRVITYDMSKDQEDSTKERKILEKELKFRIKEILINIGKIKLEKVTQTPSESAVAAIENNQPNKANIIRHFLKWMHNEIDRIAPHFTGADEDDELLLQAITESENITIDFSKVCNAISMMGDQNAALEIYKSFDYCISNYNPPKGFSGSYKTTDFDYYKFLGHELFVILISFLIVENKWDIITILLSEYIYIENRASGTPGLVSFRSIADVVGLLRTRNVRLNKQRVSLHADILYERHSESELAKYVPFNQFVDADYLLFLRSEFEETNHDDWYKWLPWSTLLLDNVPRYIIEAKRREFAQQLLGSFKLASIDSLKSKLHEHHLKYFELFNAVIRIHPFRGSEIDDIGTL